MSGDKDGRRRKPGRERNGDLNTAALFPFAAKTPAGKRNRKRSPGPSLRRGSAEKSDEKSGAKSAIPIGNKIKIKFIKELHFQARKRAIFRKR